MAPCSAANAPDAIDSVPKRLDMAYLPHGRWRDGWPNVRLSIGIGRTGQHPHENLEGALGATQQCSIGQVQMAHSHLDQAQLLSQGFPALPDHGRNHTLGDLSPSRALW